MQKTWFDFIVMLLRLHYIFIAFLYLIPEGFTAKVSLFVAKRRYGHFFLIAACNSIKHHSILCTSFLRTSSAIVRPIILDSIFDTVLLSIHPVSSVSF